MKAFRRAFGEEGATAVEYAIMVAFIASVIFATVKALGEVLPPYFCMVLEAIGGVCP